MTVLTAAVLQHIVPVVLIGGRSRRFGRDKLREPLGDGSWLVDRPVAALREVFGPRVVGLGDAAPEVVARFDRHLPDRYPGIGPAGGLLTALLAFDAPVFLLSGDLVLIGPDVIRGVIDAATEGADAVLAEGDALEPCIGLYRPAVRSRLENRVAAGIYRLFDLVEQPQRVSFPAALLRGANTPEVLSELIDRALRAEASSAG